ncbi:hypothetical protein QFC20_004231 [Naganishia adeliensis]|uniref:Uncharacterized protein n=1 Tax=Naganishia adeliensis TaxID=92952 RepID=A0ACC2W1Z2_9TREE|nr:hypothetical protein QFC20_004231 [Naganishia adeliensis]
MNSERTSNARQDLGPYVTRYMDLLEKALSLTTLGELFLKPPRATLNLLREDGMRDMFLATGDWEVDRTGTIAAARARPFAGGNRASVSIIKPEGSPYPEGYLVTSFGSHELPMTSFGSPADGTFRAGELASEISRTFQESGPGGSRTSLVESLRLLLHRAIRAGAQFETPSLPDNGPVASLESKAESESVIPPDTSSYLGILTEDAQLVDRNGDNPNGHTSPKGSVVLVHTGSLYQPKILGSMSRPNPGTPEHEREREFCETLARPLSPSQNTDRADRLTAKAMIEAIDAVIETLTSHSNYGSSALTDYGKN